MTPSARAGTRSSHSPRIRQIQKTRRRRLRCWRLALEPLEDRTLLTVSISGTVFNDLNSNAVRDGNEPGLQGAAVFLHQNQDGIFSGKDVTMVAQSPALTSDPFGAGVSATVPLSVTGLPDNIAHLRVGVDLTNNSPDRVLMALISPSGLTNGNAPNLIFLGAGQHFTGSFDDQAATPATLAQAPFGGSYRPFNPFTDPGSHIYDGSPNGGWYLLLADVSNGTVSNVTVNKWSLTFSVPEPSTQTDSNGNYSFSDVPAGKYEVGLTLPGGDVRTFPLGGTSQSVAVAAGQTTAGVNFGVHAAPDLAGVAFQIISPATDWGKTVTFRYTLTNQGAGNAGPFDVQLRLSPNGVIRSNAGDPVLDTANNLHFSGLAAFSSTSGTLTVQLPGSPGAPPSGFAGLDSAYLGFVIDPTQALTETDVSNNSNQGQAIDLSVIAPLPNQAVTAAPGVHQQPSIAIDPTDPKHLHLVVAYMDYTIGKDGYAGIGVATSHDGGNTWQQGSPVPLPAGFDEAAGYPVAQFDDLGHLFVSFMAVTFLGPKPPLIYPRGQDPNSTSSPKAQYTSYEFQANNGIFVARSDDGGVNWSTPVAVVSHLFTGTPVVAESIPDLAIDTIKTLPDGSPNPNHGNLYLTWTRAARLDPTFGLSVVKVAVSHDDGASWSAPRTLPAAGNSQKSAAGNGNVNFSHLTIGAEGDVYISLYDGGSFDVFHSADGGATFRAPVFDPNTGEQNGIPFGFLSAFPNQPSLFNDQFRTLPVRSIAADPVHKGTVYAVEAIQVTNIDPTTGAHTLIDAADVNFAVSHDYGQTWEAVFTVGGNTPNIDDVPLSARQAYHSVLNDDNGGRFLDVVKLNHEITSGQALPRLSVDNNGTVSVIWYDTRRDPANHNLDVFGITSTDGGKHFTANYRVTDNSFDPNAGTFQDAINHPDSFLGDALALATADGVGYAVWTDTRLNAVGQKGNQDLFFARYPIVPAPAPTDDRFDPNNSPATAVDLGAISTQRVLPRLAAGPGVDDWYKLTTAANGNLVVAAAGLQTGQQLLLQLYDSSGQTVLATGSAALDSTGQVIGQQLVFPSASGQTYLIHIGGVPFGALGDVSYSLVLQSITGDLGTQVHGIQIGNLINAGDTAIYRLAAAVTGTLQVTLTAPGNTFSKDRFYLQILSPDGATVLSVASFSGARGAGQKAVATLSVTAGQVVLISVSSFPPQRGSIPAQGTFQLEFTNFDQFQVQNPQTLFFPTHGDPSVVQSADLNGDGKLDLVVASTNFNDPISVLINNGDGTFHAARSYDAGPGSAPGLRSLSIGDFNGDGIPDLAVTNHTSGDVSVLLGNGDGTFQPQRRFNAVLQVNSIAQGDFRGIGTTDLVVLQHDANSNGEALAVLLGGGDGTFAPPGPSQKLLTTFKDGGLSVLTGDLNHDGHEDIVAFSFNSAAIDIFYGNGDGTFQSARPPFDKNGNIVEAAENVADAKLVDLNGDKNLDIITSGTVDGVVGVLINNGDGTFQRAKVSGVPNIGGVATTIASFVVGDFGNFISGTDPNGNSFGHEDIIAIARPRVGTNLPELIVFPEIVDSNGRFIAYDAPQVLMADQFLGPLVSGDFTGRGETDIAAAVPGGVLMLYGNPPALVANTTLHSARDLGTVVHEVTTTMTIVPGQEDAFFTMTVPTEAVHNAGPEVIDFSALFRYQDSLGLRLEVLDPSGMVLGSGARFQVVANQGEVLTLHVFGLAVPGYLATTAPRGVGAYTLDVDVLPQVVSVQAESLLPGQLGGAGGPTTSIVITLQGDRLDPAAAQNPANYHVIYLGTGQLPNPVPPQEIAVDTSSSAAGVIYDPGANLNVLSGNTTATALRQTITLLFNQPLPPGNYEVVLAPAVDAAPRSSDESGLLAENGNAVAHPVVAVVNGRITSGAKLAEPGLVPQSGTLPSFDGFAAGSPFLTQFHDDLGRVLDSGLNQLGDSSAVTQAILNQVVQYIDPSLGTPANRSASFLVLWLDPVSIDLADPAGKRAIYDLKSNTVSNQQSRTFVEVGGNIEVLVLADVAGTFKLNVSDVPPTARGGALVLSQAGDQIFALTDNLRAGIDGFAFDVPGSPLIITKKPPPPPPDIPIPTNTLAAAFLVGITTAPIFSTDARTDVSNNQSSFASLASALASSIGSFSAAGSGVNITAAAVEQFFRDFADRVSDRLSVLAGEVGGNGQLLASSGLRALQAPVHAIYSAFEAIGMPDIPLPALPLQEIGSDIIKAIVPGIKAIGAAALKAPNGQKIQAQPAAPAGPAENNAPLPNPQDFPPDDTMDETAWLASVDSEHDGPLAAAALVATGLFFGWREDIERLRAQDEEERRPSSATRS